MHLGVPWFIWIMFLFRVLSFIFYLFFLLCSNGKGVYALVQDGVGGSWGHFYSLFYFIFFFPILFYHLIASWNFMALIYFIVIYYFIPFDSFRIFTWDIVSHFFEKEAYRMLLKTVFTRKLRDLLSNRTDLIKIWTWDHSILIIIAELTLFSTCKHW